MKTNKSANFSVDNVIARYDLESDAISEATKQDADVYEVESEDGSGFIYFVVAKRNNTEEE